MLFYICCIIKTKTNIMKTLVNITNELIKERNLDYSPQLFNKVYNEVKSTPKYIECNKKRNEWLDSIEIKEEKPFSFIKNYLTTDKRLI